MTQQIKPCPFCKSANLDVAECCSPATNVQFCHVRCHCCGATGPIATAKESAIAAWNDAPRKEAPPTCSDCGHEMSPSFAAAWHCKRCYSRKD